MSPVKNRQQQINKISSVNGSCDFDNGKELKEFSLDSSRRVKNNNSTIQKQPVSSSDRELPKFDLNKCGPPFKTKMCYLKTKIL